MTPRLAQGAAMFPAWVQHRAFLVCFLFSGRSQLCSPSRFTQRSYDLLGWDTEDLADPFLLFLQRMTGSAIFLPSALGFMGVGLGVWLHYLAIRFDKRRPSKSDLFVDFHHEICSLQNELLQSLRDEGFEGPMYEVNLKLHSLDTRLKKIGLGLNLLGDWSLKDQRLMMTAWLQILQVYSKDGMIALAREEIDVAIKKW